MVVTRVASFVIFNLIFVSWEPEQANTLILLITIIVPFDIHLFTNVITIWFFYQYIRIRFKET